MRQAIITKYLPPTNHRGARIKATCDAGSITLPWDYTFNQEDNHGIAATALATKMGWEATWTPGGIGNDCVWVARC